VHYPISRWGVRRAVMKELAAHLLRRVRAGLGVPMPRRMDVASAQEISTICHFMAWMDYFLDKERMFLDCLLELRAGEHSAYAVAEARGLSSLGFGFMTYDVRRLARHYHVDAEVVARQTNNPSAMAFATFAMGFLDFYDGRWDACDANLGSGATVYRDAGDLHRWGGAMLMLSFVVHLRGDLAQMAAMGAELVRAGQDAADPQLTSWGFQVRGYVALAAGPLDDAVARLREGAELASKIPAWDNFLYQKSLLGKCLVLQGKLDEARVALREAQRVMQVERLRRPFDQVEVLTAVATCSLALVERAEGDARAQALRDAARDCRLALRSARTQPGWLAQALRLHGTLDWLCGRHASAQRCWGESLALAERSAFPIERALTLLEKGRRLGEAGLIEQASEAFEQTGAKTFQAFALHALAQVQGTATHDAAAIRHGARAIAALEAVQAHGALKEARATAV
jgi:tetratricopeptide (TPR) repeat protein